MSADYGIELHRKLTLGYNGNIRLYSWGWSEEEQTQTWVVSWQAIQTLARFMVFVGPTVCASMLLVLTGNALAFHGIR